MYYVNILFEPDNLSLHVILERHSDIQKFQILVPYLTFVITWIVELGLTRIIFGWDVILRNKSPLLAHMLWLYMGTSLCPSSSTSLLVAWESNWGWTKALGSCTRVQDHGFRLWVCSALADVATWGVKQQMADLCLSFIWNLTFY